MKLKKKQWQIFAVIAVIIIIIMVNQNNQKAKASEIGLKIHYYADGKEVFPENNLFSLFTPPGIYLDNISIDVIGTNTGNMNENLIVENVYPPEFWSALPTNYTYLSKGDVNQKILISKNFSVLSLERYTQPVRFFINISTSYTDDYYGQNNIKIYSSAYQNATVKNEPNYVKFRTTDLNYDGGSAIAYTTTCSDIILTKYGSYNTGGIIEGKTCEERFNVPGSCITTNSVKLFNNVPLNLNYDRGVIPTKASVWISSDSLYLCVCKEGYKQSNGNLATVIRRYKFGESTTTPISLSVTPTNSTLEFYCKQREVVPAPSLCYQESANVFNQVGTDGTCGLQYSGSSVYSPNYLTVTYTKPTIYTGAIWKIKHGTLATYNVTIPSSCFSQSNLQLRFYSSFMPNSQISYGQCFNGSWVTITSTSTSSIPSFGSTSTDKISSDDGDWNTQTSFYNTNNYWYNSPNIKAGDIYEEAIIWKK